MGTGALVMALWASVVAVWIAAGCLALGMSLLYPALFSAALDDVPDHERSQAVGTFSLFFDLSQGVGAPILGVVVALTGERAAFLVAAMIAGAGFCLMVATTLHSVATGNILPASVPLVCVDINPATVTKLADRGSSQARGIVTDVGLFLEQLAMELAPTYRRG